MEAIVHSVYGVENPLMDMIAHVELSFLSRFGKKPGTMHLVENAEIEALLREVPARRLIPGGSAANTMRGIAHLGAGDEPPLFNGAVGRDQTGDAYCRSIEEAGVAPAIARKRTPTGVSLILVTPDGERTMNTYLGACRDFQPEDLDLSRLARSRMLYLTGYLWDTDNQRRSAHAAAEAFRAGVKGGEIAFDLADPFAVRRYGEAFRSWIPGNVDILFGNKEELSLLVGTDCAEDCVGLAGQLAPLVVMKAGENGCYVGGREQGCLHAPAFTVKVVDTTGAGDAFAAGFLHARLAGRGLEECATLANRLASRICGVEGCDYSQLGSRTALRASHRASRDAVLPP